MNLNPHDYATARRTAERLRQTEQDAFWRSAEAAWRRVNPTPAESLTRSQQRLQALLARRTAVANPCC